MSDDEVSNGEIVRCLKVMDGKLDKVTADHETRIRALEKWMYALPAALVLSIGSVGTTIFLAVRG